MQRTDPEGYFDEIAVTAANVHDSQVLSPILKEVKPNVRILADKGYASTKNGELLNNQNLKDGIMNKASRNKALDHYEMKRNKIIKKTRWVIEQSFGTLKRLFLFTKAKYFSAEKVLTQAYLKVICVNLLKASNKISHDF